MRGFMFEISINPEQLRELTADEFAARSDSGTWGEWFHDEDANCVLENYESSFKNTGIIFDTDDKGLYLAISEQAKLSHFKSRYECTKKVMEDMSLLEFATSSCDTLKSLIEDTWTDAVFWNYPVTWDRFIREAELDKKYYIGNVIGMH